MNFKALNTDISESFYSDEYWAYDRLDKKVVDKNILPKDLIANSKSVSCKKIPYKKSDRVNLRFNKFLR